MKKLGIVGGLGPMATVYFMELITDMTQADVDQEHIEIFMHSRPQIPDRTKFILGESNENPLPMILEACDGLIKSGADVIAIPCITAHYFHDDLMKLEKPFVNSLVETATYLKDRGITKAGLMATDGTVRSGLFQKVLNEYGIECITPSIEGQKKVMSLIYDNVKAGRAIDTESFRDVKYELRHEGAQVVLLGCTELSIIKRDADVGPGVLDVLEVLAKTSVEMCATLKDKYKELITE
ncbi:MAG: amino acid racemase [Lachnospiraceae bacterium]|nr:amino acid racemase [Lachnospiraceae bacterium]